MKKALKSYISFTRAEHGALAAISILLLVLIGVRATMYLLVHPEEGKQQNERLINMAEIFKNTAHIDSTAAKKDYQDKYDENTNPMPGRIDLNTADSATLVRLKGIGPATAEKIIAYRAQHRFKSVPELLKIRHIPDETFELIKPHLYVSRTDR